MAKKKKSSKKREPAYRKQKGTHGDRAFVELGGKRHYLGEFGSKESRREYHRLLAEWSASGGEPPARAGEVSVVRLIARFREHSKTYYRRPDGTPTGTAENFKPALSLLRELYEDLPVSEFGPRQLKALRQKLMDKDNARTYINDNVKKIRHVFGWGVSEGLVPTSVYKGLETVQGLRKGRSNARETEKVRPVAEKYVDALEPHLSRQVWAMIQIQLLTGARSGEIVMIRPCDIDTSAGERFGKDVWIYTPEHHKTEHHGHEHFVVLGPKAQEVIGPFLRGRSPKEYVFSPREADEEFRQKRHAERKTPLSCGNTPGSNRKKNPAKKPGDHYTTGSYRQAIHDACEKAKVPKWNPHRLRHTRATYLRKKFGIEAAQVILGDKSLPVVELYAERDVEKAVEIMAEIG